MLRIHKTLIFLCFFLIAAGTVTANTPPTASDGSIELPEASSRRTIYFYNLVSDPEQQYYEMTYTLVSAPSNGTLEYYDSGYVEWTPGVSTSRYYCYYTPDPGFTGTDTFTWKCNDGTDDSNVATFTVTVTANTAPVANNQSETMVEGVEQRRIYLSYTDPDFGQPFTWTLMSTVSNGTLEYYDGGYKTVPVGTPLNVYYWYYTPNPGYTGTDSFTWKMSDSIADSGTATCSITVNANSVPVAHDMKGTAVKNTALVVKASFTDPDAQTFTLSKVTDPSHGTVSIAGTNFTYTPDTDFTGEDSFTWKVNDGMGDSNEATCTVLVREEGDPAGMLVILAVNHLLLSEITAEVNRLKTDIENSGHTAIIKSWNTSTDGGTEDLWNYLKSEYEKGGQYLAGAILIGNMPKARNISNNQYTDLVYWNMETYRATTTGKRHIWVSRMWGTSGSGGVLFAGDEITLLKRALKANHEYRTGISRLPHSVFHYDSAYPGAAGDMNNALDVWPEVEYLSPHLGFQKGGELIHEESHGGPGSYNEGKTSTYSVHDFMAQVRFVNVSSCSSGAFGGVVCNQLLTRGGGNIMSVGASATAYSGQIILMQNTTTDINFRAALAGGDTWGFSYLRSFPYTDYYRLVFYGDLSIPAMASPLNLKPVVDTFTADVTSGSAPLTVNFSAGASDPDDAVALYEWYVRGFQYGRVDPDISGTDANASYTYKVPHRYPARVQVEDGYKARTFKTIEIAVGPELGKPIRVNCGRVMNAWNGLSKHYVDGFDFIDSASRIWLHDQVVAAGTWGCTTIDGNKARTFSGDVTGTSDDYIYLYHYLDYHRSGFTYKVPLQNGDYTVNFCFADMANTETGQRLIDLSLEGALVESAYDIVAAGGSKTPVILTKTVTVSDGELNLNVITNTGSPSVNNNNKAILNSFEVVPVGYTNQSPTAADDAASTAENIAVNVDVLANDSDPDGDPLFIASITQPSDGTAVKKCSKVVYTPDTGFTGLDTFTYTVSDGNGGSDIATVTVTVSGGGNNSPTAVDDADSTVIDTPVTVDVLANDTDIDGDTITVSGVGAASDGTVANNTVDVTYTPDPGFTGTDSFTYTVSDGNGGTDTATVTVTVTNGNDPPDAVDDADSTDEDNPVDIDVLSNDSDPNGDTLTVSGVTQPANGTVVNNTTDVTYTPDGDFNGTDTFTYTVSDGNGGTDTATVTVTVNSINDAPNAVNDSTSTPEDTAKTIDVCANDSDPDGDTLTISGVTQPANGTVVNNTTDVTYTPDGDFNGVDTFTYTVSDGNGGTDTATVTVTVNSINDAPDAADDSASTDIDTAKTIDVLSNDTDADGDTLTVSGVGAASNGTVVNNTVDVTYTPNAGFSGTDTFTYTVSDGNGGTDTAAVTVTVVEGGGDDDNDKDKDKDDDKNWAGCMPSSRPGSSAGMVLLVVISVFGLTVKRRDWFSRQ
ncbi:Ig-like domain-containing protein [Planctomycetota bacterium]